MFYHDTSILQIERDREIMRHYRKSERGRQIYTEIDRQFERDRKKEREQGREKETV